MGLVYFFAGLACGLACLGRLLFALLACSPFDDGGHERAIRDEMAARWKSLSPAERKAHRRHQRRKKQYVRVMARLSAEVRRRRIEEYARTGIDPDLHVANAVWREWRMDEWLDVHLADDCPFADPSDGGAIAFDQPQG